MPNEFNAGQIYESETGERVIITRVDGDRVSFVATNGTFVRNDISTSDIMRMFPKYCGETTVSNA